MASDSACSLAQPRRPRQRPPCRFKMLHSFASLCAFTLPQGRGTSPAMQRGSSLKGAKGRLCKDMLLRGAKPRGGTGTEAAKENVLGTLFYSGCLRLWAWSGRWSRLKTVPNISKLQTCNRLQRIGLAAASSFCTAGGLTLIGTRSPWL